MAERVVSPGVFTNEVDQSFLAGGVAQIGAAVIGNTVKGPALIPTQITSFGDFESTFGSYTDDSYVPFLVREYLRNGNIITVTRLLYEDGYTLSNGVLAVVASSGSTTPSTFSSGSLTFNHIPSGSLVAGGPDEVTIGGVDFTFVSESAGYSNSATQIFVEFPKAGGATTTTTVAENLKDAINNNASLHNLNITATNSTNILILSGSTAGELALSVATGSGGDTTATTLAFGIPAAIAGGVNSISAVNHVTHVLHPTQPVTTTGATNLFEDSIIADGGTGSFEFRYSGSFSAAADTAIGWGGSFLSLENEAISASIDSNSNIYMSKVFGNSPKSVDYPVYVQYENKNASSLFSNLDHVSISLEKLSNFAVATDFAVAATPIITSQKIGTTTKPLFQIHTLSHGTDVNNEIKIGIRDIKLASEVSDPNGYGTFTVEVRRVNTTNVLPNLPFSSEDTDKTPDLIETFQNVNLDPDSPKYISRVIGDRFQTVTDNGDIKVNGDYPNNSKFIRVSVESGVSNSTNNKELVPFGFQAVKSPIPNVGSGANLNAVSYATSQSPSGQNYSPKNYFGFDFTNLNNLNYLAPTPSSGSTAGNNSAFYLGDMFQDTDVAFPNVTSPYVDSLQGALTGSTFTDNVALATRKFIVPLQGGFDGAQPNLKKYSGTNLEASNTFGHDCSGTSTGGTKAYNKAFKLLENTDFYDINMLLTPGIIDSLHPLVTSKAQNLAEERQDTFYVMDTNAITDGIDKAVTQVTNIDSNYTACYYPWVRIINPAKNIPIFVPPSVVVPGALAFNDAIAAPWFAPAGLNRGGLDSVLATYINLSQKQRDTLYEARINPIANFPNEGVCIWGQKTLQARPSALDRVNVRRLLIAVKKFIASSTKFLVFEQNTSATRTRFTSIVNPYLEQVRAQQGLHAFRVVMDETNNTPDIIDQNILYGQLFLQPTRTAEFIILDFNIQPTGASFPE